jgi:hypothetical protein
VFPFLLELYVKIFLGIHPLSFVERDLDFGIFLYRIKSGFKKFKIIDPPVGPPLWSSGQSS